MKKQLILLCVIVLLGAVLRLYKLDTVPAINADEAALGYNAYALLKTGLDEHGNKWPLHFQSFNDFKPGLTVYAILPFIAAFGLNEWSVRLLPALIGIFTIVALYLLAKEMVREKTNKQLAQYFPLLAAFLLSVSPWHIHFSRGAWEVNIATFFLVSGAYFFMRWRERSVYLLASCVVFVLSLYTYHAARIITPLLVLVLVANDWKALLQSWKRVVSVGSIGFLLCLPLLFSLVSPAGLARAGGVGLWSDSGPENRVNELRGNYENTNGVIPRLLHNKPIGYTLAFLSNWAEHYWGEFLFLSGDDIQRNKVPETGQLHLIEIAFLGVGILYAIRSKNKKWQTVFLWLLIAPLPAALTFQSPHALRSANMVIPLTLLSAYGLFIICTYFKSYTRAICVVMTLLIALSVGRYIHMYYSHMAKAFPFSSQYGVKELVTYLSPIHTQYQKVIVTDRYDQPYILFLFYMKYDPALFQKEHTLTARDQYGFSTVRSFSNFSFESVPYEKMIQQYPNSLIVGTSQEILPEANISQDIIGENGYRYFRVVVN